MTKTMNRKRNVKQSNQKKSKKGKGQNGRVSTASNHYKNQSKMREDGVEIKVGERLGDASFFLRSFFLEAEKFGILFLGIKYANAHESRRHKNQNVWKK